MLPLSPAMPNPYLMIMDSKTIQIRNRKCFAQSASLYALIANSEGQTPFYQPEHVRTILFRKTSQSLQCCRYALFENPKTSL